MTRALRILQLLGINAVPGIGMGAWGWSNATALALYWCETLLLALVVAVEIDVHRRLTNKRGHYIETVITTTRRGVTGKTRRVGHFVTMFLAFALMLSAAQAIVLGVLLNATDAVDLVSLADLTDGVKAIALVLLIGLAIDLRGIADRPFAWIESVSVGVLRRVFVVQVTIMIGFILTAWWDLPRATLIAFMAIKFWTDVLSRLPEFNRAAAPAWIVRIGGPTFARIWHRERRQQDAREAADEEIYSGTPIPYEKR